MNLLVMRRMMALPVVLLSMLVTACGLHCKNSSSETLTVYQDAPKMNPLDVGPPGNSPGDVYYFSALLHSSSGGPVIGEVFGAKTLIKTAADASTNVEQRATALIFTFRNREDQIVVMGVPEYPANAAEFNQGQPVVRAILGGTGKYIGARGQLTSTRSADGSYIQVFTLLK